MKCDIYRTVALCAVGLLMSGCGAGGGFPSAQSPVAPITAGDGRLYVYRRPASGLQGMFATGSVDVLVDNNRVGPVRDGFFYVDLPPGPHTVACSGRCTESAKIPNMSGIFHFESGLSMPVQLAAGEARYVAFEFLFDITPPVQRMLVVDLAQGSQDIADLPYLRQ